MVGSRLQSAYSCLHFSARVNRMPTVLEQTSQDVTATGLRFAERMTGFYHPGAPSWQEAWEHGRALGAGMSLLLAVDIPDLDAMLKDEQHRANLSGTVECSALSPDSLTIVDGDFRILTIDPDRVGAYQMLYSMRVRSASGREYLVRGAKHMHNDPGFDVWADTTTLLVDVFDGASASAEPVGRALLRLSPHDLLRLLGSLRVINASTVAETVRARARFGRFFAGTLFDTYGGVLAPAFVQERNAEPTRRRALRLPAPEAYHFLTDDGAPLLLTRYRGGAKGPVLLVAGMGTSSLSFVIDTVDVGLAEFLCAAGYDVWLFDYRASPAVAVVREQSTLDQIALHDYPCAIKEVRRISGAESVQVIGHCVGAGTLVMTLAAGKSPDIRSAICSQFSLHVHTTPLIWTKVSLHLGSLLGSMGVDLMNAKYDSQSAWLDRLYDRLLRLYPAFEGEVCDSPVCRRIRFIYGETFLHDQLNHDTHRLIYEIFGEANLTILKHLSRVFREHHVVDSTGAENYLPHIDRLKVPIAFVHGAHNKIFLPQGSRESYELLSQKNGAELYELKIFPEYAHMDLFIGKNAHRDVFPYFLQQLDRYN